jgi:hypothetical protein
MKRTVYLLMIVMLLCGTVVAGAQESVLHPFKVGFTAGTGLHFNYQMSLALQEDAWIGAMLHISPLIAVRPGIALYVFNGDVIDNIVSVNNFSSYLERTISFYTLAPRANTIIYPSYLFSTTATRRMMMNFKLSQSQPWLALSTCSVIASVSKGT